MCDTMVALPDASNDGVTLFAKNSDRPEFDSQGLVTIERQHHQQGASVRAQYAEVPQAKTTYRTMGFRPYWCWGYETGMNEHRVAIGNEAIYTKALHLEENRRQRGLIGMDLARLALERGKTAYEAMNVIAELLQRFGQWGSAVPGSSDEDGSYENSFLIADPKEAWVLETAGRRWVAKRVSHGVYSVSNEPSITTDWDESSEDLVGFAVDQGWWPSSRRSAFNFALAYGDHVHRSRQVSHIRSMRSRQLLQERQGQLDIPWLIRILRDHYEDTFLQGPMFSPDNPDFHTLCMHASPGDFTWGNTASSAVATLPEAPESVPVLWGSLLTPCTGVFSPYFIDAPVPPQIANTGKVGAAVRVPENSPPDQPAPDSPWWAFKGLLDTIRQDFNAMAPLARARFDGLEEKWLGQAENIREQALTARAEGRLDDASQLLAAFSADCLGESLEALSQVKGMLAAQGETAS